jgi:hypothetical protein
MHSSLARLRPLLPAVCVLLLWASEARLQTAHAQLPEAADTCLACHDDAQLNAVLHGPHAVLLDARNRFAQDGCASCHGASEAHMRRPPRGESRAATDVRFARGEGGGAGDAVCLDCHRGSAMHWTGSAHADAGLACVDCHQLHTLDDPMLSADTEVEHCASCHRKEHAEFMKVSAHPLDLGRMQCMRLPRPARQRHAGRTDPQHAQRDLPRMPRRNARSVSLGASAGRRGLHELPHPAR